MTVYHYGTEVDVLGGDVNEGWAVITYSDREMERDVSLNELKAEDGYEEIYEAIDEAGDYRGESYDEHLRLDVRLQKERVRIVTANGEHLLDANMPDVIGGAEDDWQAATDVADVIRDVDMAHQQPRRFIYRHRDSLLEVEA